MRTATTFLPCAAAAALFAALFAPADLWWLAPLVPALAWIAAIRAASWRRLAAVALPCWFGAWLWLQWWIRDVSAVGMPALAGYLAVLSTAGLLLLRLLGRHGPTRRLPAVAVLPVAWIGWEWMRAAVLFDGYPWYLLAHPLIEAPILAQGADLLGAMFAGSLVALAGGLLADLAPGSSAAPRARAIGAAATVLAIAAWIGYGAFRLRQTDALDDGGALRVLAIQTNLPQSNKLAWELDAQRRDFAAFAELTRSALAAAEAQGEAVDLIAWPETMLPGFGFDLDTIRTFAAMEYAPAYEFAVAAAELAAELDRPFLLGSPVYERMRLDEQRRFVWDRHHNSAYLLRPGAPGPLPRYDKIFLTPFGETMPYISALPWLEERLLAIGARGMRFDLDVGDGDPLRLELEGTEVATPICFEDTVPWLVRRMAYEAGSKRTDLIVNLSNDGWFGRSDAGRVQHAQIARWRCVELRVPMVRVVNTGVTIAIDSAGRLVGAVGEGRYGTPRTEGWLVASLAPDPRIPLAARVGDAWAWVCLLLTAGAAAWSIHARRRPPSDAPPPARGQGPSPTTGAHP